MMEKFRSYCREFGRDPTSIGLEGRVTLTLDTQDRWVEELDAWRAIGASHVTLNTMMQGLTGAEQHLRRIGDFRKALPAGSLRN